MEFGHVASCNPTNPPYRPVRRLMCVKQLMLKVHSVANVSMKGMGGSPWCSSHVMFGVGGRTYDVEFGCTVLLESIRERSDFWESVDSILRVNGFMT